MGNAQESHATGEALVHPLEPGHLRDTGRTPGGKEVDDEWAIAELAVVDPSLPFQVRKRKLLERPALAQVSGVRHAADRGPRECSQDGEDAPRPDHPDGDATDAASPRS